MKLTAETNSTVNLRLRGSGLNAELVGEIVWLGATQKQAGICFKGLSPDIQKEIADWIAREERDSATAPSGDRSRPMSMPAAPPLPVTGEKSVTHALSSALAMSRAASADSPSDPGAEPSEPPLPAASEAAISVDAPAPILDSAPAPAPEFVSPIPHSDVPAMPSFESLLQAAVEVLGAAPVVEPAPELVSPIQHFDVPEYSGGSTEDPTAETLASPEPGPVEQPLFNHLIFDRPPINHPHGSPAPDPAADVLSPAATAQAREGLPQATPESAGNNESIKTAEIKPISPARVPRPTRKMAKPTAADLWLPPEVVKAWRQANPQRKLVIAAAAAACLMVFSVLLALSLVHNGNPSSRSGGNLMAQKSIASPAATSLSLDFPQVGPLPAPRAPHVSLRPQPDPLPPPSFFETLARGLWGANLPKPDNFEEPVVWTEITDAQVVVPVWTSKSSGYYFCKDSPYIESEHPGAYMSQGDALQTGYQPILGTFCN